MTMIRVLLLINIGVNYHSSFAVISRSNELKSKDLNYDRRELGGNNSLKLIRKDAWTECSNETENENDRL